MSFFFSGKMTLSNLSMQESISAVKMSAGYKVHCVEISLFPQKCHFLDVDNNSYFWAGVLVPNLTFLVQSSLSVGRRLVDCEE